jgi:hypothetical protein
MLPISSLLYSTTSTTTGVEAILGYDNVSPSPYTNSNYYLLVKYKFANVSTTNVGIKIPILGVIIGALNGSPTPAIEAGVKVWNSTTTDVPTWNFNQYLPGYYRDQWNLSSDSNYFYLYTNTALGKSGLNTTDFFWLGFEITGAMSFPRFRIKHYPSYGTINAQFRPYVFGGSNVVDTYTYLEILDYNS